MNRDERERAEMAELRERYEAVMDAVTIKEREEIEALRVKRENGDRYCAYGHDMHAAIAHGYNNRARNSCAVALVQTGWALSYGRGRSIAPNFQRTEFAITLDRLIEAAAVNGVTVEQVEEVLSRQLKDRTGTERLVREGAARGA